MNHICPLLFQATLSVSARRVVVLAAASVVLLNLTSHLDRLGARLGARGGAGRSTLLRRLLLSHALLLTSLLTLWDALRGLGKRCLDVDGDLLGTGLLAGRLTLLASRSSSGTLWSTLLLALHILVLVSILILVVLGLSVLVRVVLVLHILVLVVLPERLYTLTNVDYTCKLMHTNPPVCALLIHTKTCHLFVFACEIDPERRSYLSPRALF